MNPTIDKKVKDYDIKGLIKFVTEMTLKPGSLINFTKKQAKEEGLGWPEKIVLYPGMLFIEGARLGGYGLILYKLGSEAIKYF